MCILEVVVDMFGEKGYVLILISEIVKCVGVVEGIIFCYYKIKKDLLLVVVMLILIKFVVLFFV